MICRLSQINKETNRLCHDNHFWVNKFQHHQLQMIHDHICNKWALIFYSTQKSNEYISHFKLNNMFFHCTVSFKNVIYPDKLISILPYRLINHINKYNILIDCNFQISFDIRDGKYTITHIGVSVDYNNARMGFEDTASEEQFKILFFNIFYYHNSGYIKLDKMIFRAPYYSYDNQF